MVEKHSKIFETHCSTHSISFKMEFSEKCPRNVIFLVLVAFPYKKNLKHLKMELNVQNKLCENTSIWVVVDILTH